MTRKLLGGWVVAGLAVGIAAAQPPVAKSPDATKKDAPAVAQPDPIKAADPLGVMLAEAKGAYGKVRDYSCTFTRQERVNGLVGPEQVAEMKVRTSPASLYVRFAKPDTAAGLELCYVSTRADGKLRYRPAGAKGQNGFQTLTPDDSKVKADFRRAPSELGIGPILDLVAGIVDREKTLNNQVEVFTGDFQFAGRNVTRYEIYTRRPHTHRYAYRTVVFVDKETKLPVRLEAYDAPKPGLAAGDLIEAFSYSDIKFNVGIGASAFDF
jgi:hypothetical protein